MNINDFIEQISLGELSNLYIGLEGQTELSLDNKKKIINYVNQGLKTLCSRFSIRKNEIIIRAKDQIALYHLRKEYSMTNGTAPIKYLDDTNREPFNNDLIKILEVYNEIGIPFPINDRFDHNSVFTPSYDTLQITHPIENEGYAVIYQALHPIISFDSDGEQEFNLPPLLEECLTSFVAGKIYTHMNGEANKATGMEYMTLFESKCLMVTDSDLASESSVVSHNKAQQKGFV